MLKIKDNVDCSNFKEKYGFDDSGECYAIKWEYIRWKGHSYEENTNVALYIDHRDIYILSNRTGNPDNNRYFGHEMLPILFDLIKDGLVEKVEE